MSSEENNSMNNSQQDMTIESAVDEENAQIRQDATSGGEENAHIGQDTPPGGGRMIRWLKAVLKPFGLLRENIKSLIAFAIVFRILLLLVLFPILTWAQRLWLIGNNTKIIAWYNAGSFIKNPITWIVLLGMILLLAAAAIYEQFAIYDMLHASNFGLRRTMRQIFSAGFDMFVERLRIANWGMIPFVYLVLHFGSIMDVSSVTSVIRIPGFILEDFSKHPWEMVVYDILRLVASYFFLRWAFAIPIMMEEDNFSFRDACRKSWRMTKGWYTARLLLLSLFWVVVANIVFLGGGSLVDVVWYLLSVWVTPATTAPFTTFFWDRWELAFLIVYFVFFWVSTPFMMASIQSAYYMRKKGLGEKILDYTEAPHFFHKYPILKWGLVAVCLVCIYFSVPRRYAQVQWIFNTDYGMPMIMAHRGYSAKAPENTLPAFQKCIDEDFTAAELDVQMLKDGTIVVLHDDNLERTTGVNNNVWEVTYDEIKDLDNGRFFDEEYAGTTIPTLDEVIKLAKSGRNKLYLNIEIKRTGHDEGIEQKIIDIILANDFLNNCDITSQDYETLVAVRAANPQILTAYTSVIGIGDIETLDAADIISINETFATYENIERIHRAGKRVFVWTVNEEDTMEELITLNVDAILTNSPDVCFSVLSLHGNDVLNIVRRIQTALTFL